MKPVAIIASNKDKNFTNWQINFVNRPRSDTETNEDESIGWHERRKNDSGTAKPSDGWRVGFLEQGSSVKRVQNRRKTVLARRKHTSVRH